MDALRLDADETREGEVDEQDKKTGLPLYARRSQLQNAVRGARVAEGQSAMREAQDTRW